MDSKPKNDIKKDERFAHLFNNPRYRKLPEREKKVKIDSRFKSMFKDDKFQVKYSVDKYGREVSKTSSEDLKKYYLQSSEESSDEEKDDGNAVIESGNEMPDTLKNKLKDLEVDYIRGEGVFQSDSSDDESTSDEADEVYIEHVWGELDHDAETTEESSRRIACMHMDWDRIRAVDILMMCNSFIPSGSGSILSVKIFPSEFGKERMAQEELQGPQELTKIEHTEEQPIDEEDEEYKEKLREYQLNRLKYFYAVIEFDSVKCADIVYKECDGLEYETTANRLDLRFIPDDMEFDDEPKDVCNELPERSKYQPRIFFTTALQQAKVELTWDETDVGRKEITEKLFSDKRNEITDNDLRKFVACSSEDENSEDDNSDNGNEIDDEDNKPKDKINLYKSLLSEINQKEEEKKKKQVEMEFTWGVGVDKKKDIEDDEESEKEELTPFEKILEKKKLKKKARKEARKKKFKNDDEDNDDDDDEDGYSSSDFDDIDMNDPYFAEEFANNEFKMPKKMSNKKQKKKSSQNSDDDEEKKRRQMELELLLSDATEDKKAHFSLKQIQENETMSSSKRKRRMKKSKKEAIKELPDDNFELNIKDDRFNAVYSKPDFNIDPTDPNFKKTKGMEVLIQEKLKRRYNDDAGESSIKPDTNHPEKKIKTKDVALNMLVKNIKRKVGK
ncbi:CLUMA_CG010818, isoform A [Clunio marinus]|uniref:CLUMA_CG010818, isoform A n=1 Tax=Clunio marinus TaxID=568069 RepID=A0A1J1IAW5_9DIPT|nr:CLUMA_CG010818, isoform A [Clunio marinus]